MWKNVIWREGVIWIEKVWEGLFEMINKERQTYPLAVSVLSSSSSSSYSAYYLIHLFSIWVGIQFTATTHQLQTTEWSYELLLLLLFNHIHPAILFPPTFSFLNHLQIYLFLHFALHPSLSLTKVCLSLFFVYFVSSLLCKW